MKSVGTLVLATLLAFLAASAARAVDGPPGDKNEQGLTAAIVADKDKDTYTLDPSQQGKDFRDSIDKAKNPRAAMRLPSPPVVELTLRITNTTADDITINLGGDDSQITLKLEGPGAVTVDNLVAMTMDFKIGNPTKIPAGKSIDIPINSLAFGMRGISQHAYWTEPGDYTLKATLLYPIGEKQTTVTSGAIKLKIEAEKPAKP